MAPSRCKVTMAGYSFSVTVQAPNAPCMQIQTSVAAGHQALNAFRTDGSVSGTRCWRRRSIQVAMANVKISAPTPVAR